MQEFAEDFRHTAARGVIKPSEAMLRGKPIPARDLAVLEVIEEASASYYRRERRFLWWFVPLACLLFVLV
jgi:hypothetical protein